MKAFKALIILATALSALPVLAENGMNSPYTRYGFGQLSPMEVGVNKGMGGTGIGLQNTSQINMLNPASYAAVDTLTFLLDVGMSLHNTNLTEGDVRMNARNTTFDYLAMQFRLMPKLGMTIGMVPFSNIGYNFNNSTIIDNYPDAETGEDIKGEEGEEITAHNRYYGDGGLRQITVGVGWSPFKGLSVGANLAYLYGEIYHFVYNQYSDPSITPRTKQYIADISTYKADFGLQYLKAFGKHRVTLGATYQLGHAIDDEAYIIDMISTGGTVTSSDTTRAAKFSIPTGFGVGLSYTFDDRLTIAADYSMQQYSTADFFSTPKAAYKGADYHRASIGLEYIPERITRKLLRRTRYRAGFYYATPHYYVGEHRGPTEYGATIGIGLPIMNGWNAKSLVNISGQAVHVRPAPGTGMITENYLRLSIGLSFDEGWFDKWRVQ